MEAERIDGEHTNPKPLCQGYLCDICVADCPHRITPDKAKRN